MAEVKTRTRVLLLLLLLRLFVRADMLDRNDR